MNKARIFSETLVSIFVAIATKRELKFDYFMNEIDQFCWIALNEGNVIPSLYIKMIDQALTELTFKNKGKYMQAYNTAIEDFKTEWLVGKAIEFYCSPEHQGFLTENINQHLI
ncbi:MULTISPECIES: hypothetical protein [Pseudoalteromonas]|uniref:Uncharacterized protein n=1 Tax=Pseudoalteromonas lipolytica TaxID=570156 RepID=A0ABU8SYC3_9GAMM|nr:hypothetical protein [Pseudoalteromonas sp.]MCH2088972.1 hypothetical protein [Pseudoalteromonas sp.]|tara:strand:- start:2693 stop:3031 length:339 start_codon:yes stop_codon:yes gene_type:complete